MLSESKQSYCNGISQQMSRQLAKGKLKTTSRLVWSFGEMIGTVNVSEVMPVRLKINGINYTKQRRGIL